MIYLFSKIRGYFTLAAALAAVFALFLAIVPVSAHDVTPTSSSPADQAVLAQPPGQVSLTFPEEVGENDSAIQVFDQQGRRVDLGTGGVDLGDPSHASLVVKLPALPQGIYLVKWKAALPGGNFSSGEYYFGVGRVTLPADPASSLAPAPDRMVTPWSLAGTGLVATATAIVLVFRRRVLK